MMISKIHKGVRVYQREGIGSFIAKCLIFVRNRTKFGLIGFRARVLHAFYRWRWGSSLADPDKLIGIRPADVRYRLSPPFHPVFMAGGDWDRTEAESNSGGTHRRLLEFGDMAVRRLLEERFGQGMDWEATALYRRKQSQPDRSCTDFPDERYADLDCVRDMFARLDALHDRMRREGYRSQDALGGERRHEVTVNIGRTGEIIWNGTGQHRLAMAQVLRLKRIPARVLVRHTEWQKVRRAFARGEGSSPAHARFRGHPDLEDVDAAREHESQDD